MRLKATLQFSRHSSANSSRCNRGSWNRRYFWIMRDFAYILITEQLILVRFPSFLRDTYNTETVRLTMFFAFVLYGPRSMTWRTMEHEENRYTLWTSCTDVSWKRPLLSIMRNFGCSWRTKMQILVGRLLHKGTEIILKMSYLVYFSFLSARDVWLTKGDTMEGGWTALHMIHACMHSTVCTCMYMYSTRNWVLHILNKSDFLSGKLCFLFIVHEFWHSSITYQPLFVSGPVFTEL